MADEDDAGEVLGEKQRRHVIDVSRETDRWAQAPKALAKAAIARREELVAFGAERRPHAPPCPPAAPGPMTDDD
jgi:hypothetical protein